MTNKCLVAAAGLSTLVFLGILGYAIHRHGSLGRVFYAMTASESAACQEAITRMNERLLESFPGAQAFCSPDYDQGFFEENHSVRIFGITAATDVDHAIAILQASFPDVVNTLPLKFYEKQVFFLEWVSPGDDGNLEEKRWRGPEKKIATFYHQQVVWANP